MLKPLAAAAAALLAGALWTSNALADEVAPPPADLAAPPTRWGNRMLDGHTFLYPVLHAGPFITTYYGVALGVYDESIPSVPIPGFRTTDLSLIGVTATANLGVKITDWLGIEAQGRALAVLGSTGSRLSTPAASSTPAAFSAPIVRLARDSQSDRHAEMVLRYVW